MALSPKLELRQSQSLVLTPQLQQAIKLLQMSNLELTEHVERELESNPLLEQDESQSTPTSESEAPPANSENTDGSGAESGSETAQDSFAEDSGLAELSSAETPEASALIESDGIDVDYENVYNSDSFHETPAVGADAVGNWNGGGDGEFGIEQTLSQALTLKDHLNEQLQLVAATAADRLIGAALVDGIDSAGYLRESVQALAERFGTQYEEVERVLFLIQSFDPTGVGARDLGECMALQLREMDRFDPVMQIFIDHLDLLAKHDLDGLSRLCGVDLEDIHDMIHEIRRLNPKPGLYFDDDPVQPVVPDVFVRQNADGGWHVEVNTEILPKVLVNKQYHATVQGKAKNKQEMDYLNDCMANANWLIRALDQRARTILKVASEVVRQQDAFFAQGIEHLRPLTLRMVADAIDMHESTVSRVTANKYIGTQRGIFELKYFFTTAIASAAGGDAHSAEVVRHKIKTLIDRETVDSILSDDKLVDMLKSDGIDIARRTIAKYREAMGIPSSVQRRRLKRLSA